MEEMMKKYANFLLTRCLRLESGKPLVIPYISPQKEFVNIVKQEALKIGASEVYLLESNGDETRKILESSSVEEIRNNPYFDRSKINETYEKGGVILWPDSFEPSHLKGVAEEKIKAMNEVKHLTQGNSKEARRRYEFPSCIAAVATQTWADEIFPNEENNLEKLWNLIFKITMMDKEDHIKAWEEQIRKNTERKDLLNELKLVKLTYKNNIGTDLEIGLPKNVIWQGTSKLSFDGAKDIIVNMPTYENFTSPNRNKTNGTLVSSSPLVLRGCIIENIRLMFEDGKLIKATADTNEEVLLKVLSEHEEMSYLGECAFVDYDSPINDTNLVYETILIDENRGCHIALGSAFPRTIPNGDKMNDEELFAAGLNRCPNHVDIMMGTRDLSIVGTDIHGDEVPIFVDGNFALEKIKKFIKERKDK